MRISTTPSPIPHGTSPKHAGRPLRRIILPFCCCSLLSLIPPLIVTASASIDHIDLIECSRRGIDVGGDVANTANIFFVDVSDLAVGLLLNVLRKISAGNFYVGNRLWHKQGSYPLGCTA
ncbi:hypothetical protein OROMI_023234 [Orobanche minor]